MIQKTMIRMKIMSQIDSNFDEFYGLDGVICLFAEIGIN